MRDGLRSPVLLLLGLLCAAAPSPAQQISVTVIVVNAIAQPPQPVKAAHVSLTHLISTQIAVDAQGPTNPRGEAQLLLSQSAARNGDLRIVVSGTSNLVIYEPADGQLPNLKSPIKVTLLPTGSLALLGPAQIQAYLRRLLLQVNSLQKQVNTLKAGSAQGQDPQQYLTTALADFAQATGFSHEQVDQQVAIWAQSIKLQAARSTTDEQKGLAAFALKDYATAAADFNQAGDATQEQMNAHEASAAAYQKGEQREVDAARDDLRLLISQRQAAAGADQLKLKYHDATQALESVVSAAAAEYRKHQDDSGFHELWLQAVWAAASARWREGQLAPAEQSLSLLAQAAADFDSLIREYTALGERQMAAISQNNLGAALMNEGERANGDQAIALFQQAVEAYQNALQVYSRADDPRDWAMTQDNLGIVLMDEGERVGGDQAVALLGKAVQAYQSALQVYTRADFPLEWARAENNLANALLKEGERAGGDQSVVLLDQAVQAYRAALEVCTKSALPQDWALTETNLGTALMDEGERATGDQATRFFENAVEAYRSVLEVRTQADLPQDWARTEVGLGVALMEEGRRSSGDNADALLEQAVQAYHKALEVYTQADLPQDWASTEVGLGIALMNQGERAEGAKAAGLFDQAADAYRSALQVFTITALPQDWATTQSNLGVALLTEGELASDGQREALLDQAVQAFGRALQVFTKTALPQDWVRQQANMMEANLAAAHFDDCLQQAAVLTDDMLLSTRIAIRDTMKLACQWGAGDKNAALASAGSLSSHVSALQPGFWDFSGVIRILSQSPVFASGRPAWIALFTAVQNGDSAGTTAALHQLEAILQQ